MAEIKEFVYYAEDSPTGLRWKKNIYSGKGYRILKAESHSVAGSTSGAGCHFEVTIARKRYWCHRAVWELHFGELPPDASVDHKDGDGKNNFVGNLRLVTHAVNMRNTKMRSVNTTGLNGVSYVAKKDSNSGKVYWYWRATWNTLDGVAKGRCFSEIKYGYDGAKELAVAARNSEIGKLNSLGAGYSDRHGESNG